MLLVISLSILPSWLIFLKFQSLFFLSHKRSLVFCLLSAIPSVSCHTVWYDRYYSNRKYRYRALLTSVGNIHTATWQPALLVSDSPPYLVITIGESIQTLLTVVDRSVDPIVGNLSDWLWYHNSTLLPLNKRLQHVEDRVQLSVFTDWEAWGPCVACNRPKGERRRMGRCRLKPSSPKVPFY